MERKTRKDTWRDRLRGFALAWIATLALAAWTGQAQAQVSPGCTVNGVCVSAGPRLVEVDSTQSVLLDTVFQALLPGTSITAGAIDWNSLAATDINVNALLIELGADATLSNAQTVLDTEVTLGQLQAAMVNVLNADGNTAAANALQALPLSIGALTGTIRLADLLQVNLTQGSLADIDLDVLDLVTGFVQLYNYKNVLTTGPTPVTVDASALGLNDVANVQLWLQVIEPPVYICGPAGSTQFHTAAIRAKLNTDVAQGGLDSLLTTALNGLKIQVLGVNVLEVSAADVTADVLKLQLYADIARAEGTIASINAISGAVTLDARPGITNLYIGTITDQAFFIDRQVITPALLTPTTLTNLDANVTVNLLGSIPVLEVNLQDFGVQVESSAEGSPFLMQTLSFSTPPGYPQTQALTCGTHCVGDLVATLLTNLDVTMIDGAVSTVLLGALPVGLDVDTVVNTITGLLESTLDSAVPSVLSPVLDALFGFVDDLLGMLGIGIGKGYFSVEGIFAQSCATVLSLTKIVDPTNDPGKFNLSISQGGTSVASASDVGNNGATGTVVSTPGLSYDFAETAGTNTSLAPYVTTWACTDQDGAAVGSGGGGTFALTAPALASAPRSISCRITNRVRQANLSVTKSDGSATYTPGSTATYVITVTNAGPDAVTGAVINDTLPAGATLSSAWSCTATNGTCTPASGGSAGDSSISLSVDLEANGQAQISVPVVYSNDPTDY